VLQAANFAGCFKNTLGRGHLYAWITERFATRDSFYYPQADTEGALKSLAARASVYGHTPVYEMVPIDSPLVNGAPFDQGYFNSGTWRPYHQ